MKRLSIFSLVIASLLLAACSKETAAPAAPAASTANPPAATPAIASERGIADMADRDTPVADVRPIEERVRSGFVSPGRPVEDAAAHPLRKPDQVIAWAGIDSGMSVIDLTAYSGYYSENLSWAVGPDGLVVAHNTPSVLARGEGATRIALEARLAANRLANIDTLEADFADLPGRYDPEFDAATLVNTFHDTYNFAGAEAAAAALDAIYQILSPGGFLLLIDHQGNPDTNNQQLHRIDPELVRAALTTAGFSIEGESDLLVNPEDDFAVSIFDPSVRGTSQRFIIKAVKPAN